jgi:hypothetical protein
MRENLKGQERKRKVREDLPKGIRNQQTKE